jgi:hypothetical protein
MNLVGKIFTVLIFLMCVVFGTFALMVHAAHKNWKAEYVKINDELTSANKQKAELTEQKKNLQTTLDNERKRTAERLVALADAARTAEKDKADLESKIQVEEGKVRMLVQGINEVHKRLTVLQATIDTMRSDIKVAVDQRNKTQADLTKTTDELMNAVAERGRVEKLERELSEQLIKAKEALQWNKTALENYKDKNPPFNLQGEVTSVPRPDTVEISLGADDGVRKGHKFVVTRPSVGKYIGVIEVTRVDYPNRAVCRPDKQSLSEQIQKGDHVEAKTSPR